MMDRRCTSTSWMLICFFALGIFFQLKSNSNLLFDSSFVDYYTTFVFDHKDQYRCALYV